MTSAAGDVERAVSAVGGDGATGARTARRCTDELNLPVIRADEMAGPTPRSLDEIDRWIEEDYALFFVREAYEKEKRALSVDVPFRL